MVDTTDQPYPRAARRRSAIVEFALWVIWRIGGWLTSIYDHGRDAWVGYRDSEPHLRRLALTVVVLTILALALAAYVALRFLL